MDKALLDAVSDKIPKFNEKIMNGLAVEHIKQAVPFVDALFRSASSGFPEGLEYMGYKLCSPTEEFNELIKKRNNRSVFDIARNDLFMVKYLFRFRGEDLEPRYMYLPYVRDAGILTIRGSTFSISPVLADKAISVGDNRIFIPLEGAKLTFERISHNFYLNGARETVNVVHSKIYNRSAKGKAVGGVPRVTAKHTLMHYLLCKYGLSEVFRRFANTDIKIGTSIDINEEELDTRKWHICSSTRLKPRGVRSKFYNASDLRIAIKTADYNVSTSSMIGSFFYIVDHFPERVHPEYVDHIRLWRVLLGHLIFGSDSGEGRLVDDINIHMESLDEYMDDHSRERLHKSGVPCEDVYDLFVHIIGTLSVMVLQSQNSEATMYDKQLMILRYVMFDINKAIYNFKYAVMRMNKNKITRTEIIGAMRRNLKRDEITKINRQHGEVSSVSSPGDNKYFKITANLVPQTSATGGGRGGKSKSSLVDPSKFLHSSIAEVGSYTNQPKSQPDGRTRINPNTWIDEEGNIVRKEHYIELIDGVQHKIDR